MFREADAILLQNVLNFRDVINGQILDVDIVLLAALEGII